MPRSASRGLLDEAVDAEVTGSACLAKPPDLVCALADHDERWECVNSEPRESHTKSGMKTSEPCSSAMWGCD